MDKKDFLFKFIEPTIRAKIKMDSEALFSVTDQYTADKISNEIRKRIGLINDHPIKSIVDATACVGGNTISFAKHFESVHAVEMDSVRYSYLKFNMALLGLNNVCVYHADILDFLDCLPSTDVIFIDPPWGGPSYKSQEKLELFLSNVSLHLVCKSIALRGAWKYVALKVPVNFDFEAFDAQVSAYMTRIPSSTKFRKLLLLIYKISIP
jgi:16S rRNA G966 N2-methylase RsmD